MEGLIPLVLKTLKMNNTRRQYECLSSTSAAAAAHESSSSYCYNISDFYAEGYSYPDKSSSTSTSTSISTNTNTNVGGGGGGLQLQSINDHQHHPQHQYGQRLHKYSNSFGDYYSSSSTTTTTTTTGFSLSTKTPKAEAEDMVVKPKQQLVRFRSHRFFSCVGGTTGGGA